MADAILPKGHEKLDGLPKEHQGKKQDRPMEEMVEEILGLARGITRHQTDPRPIERLNENLWRLIKSVENLPYAASRIEMSAESKHKFTVAIERLIRQEVLAVLRTAERARDENIANPDAGATPLTGYLIEAVQERIKQGEIHAKLVPEF